MTTQITTLPPAERAAVALDFDALKAEVSKQALQYADITAIENKAGRDQVHAAAMTLKGKRVEIQRRAKEVREDAVQFQKAVIAKGEELAAIIEPEEKRLIALRDGWDAEREAEKAAAAEAEAKRKAGHEAGVAIIRGYVATYAGRSAAEIQAAIDDLTGVTVEADRFEEYAPVAARAKAETLARLEEMAHTARAAEAEQARIKAAQEAEAARLAAEREELAKLRAEAAERQRVEAEAAEAARKAAAEKIAAERAELEAQQRAIREQQAEIERQQQAIKAEQDRQAAEARAAAERKAAAERAEAEAKLAAERAAAQAKADADAREVAEKLRIEHEKAHTEALRKAVEEAAAARKKREGVVPEADALVSIIAEAYDVSNEAARGWLGLRFCLTHIGFDLAKDAA